MKTPIYLDYRTLYPGHLVTNELNIYDEDPIDLYTDPTLPVIDPLNPLDPPAINLQLAATASLPYLLAPRYYLKISPPSNQPGPSITVPIHKSPNSLLKDKVRVALKPSIGWGVNGSYKVDYWEWIPNVNLPAVPSKRKITTEYWYVPTIDSEYVARFSFDQRLGWGYPVDAWGNINHPLHPGACPLYLPRRRSISVEVERTVIGDTVSDLITDVNGISLFCFPQDTYISFTESVQQESLEFNDETRSWTFSKALVGSTLVRDSSTVDGGVLDGVVQTTIEYIEPLHPNQIVFVDHDDILNDGLAHSSYFI